MKTKLLLLISLLVAMGACTTEEELLSPIWGIEYSDENSMGFASGSVYQFIDQTKSTYIAKTASMREVNTNVYMLSFSFETGETMELKVIKRTIDQNFYYPGNEGGNQLLSAIFQGELLSLDTDSKVTIQPRTEENKLATLAKINTANKGLFDGAIGRVPLLK
jgi:hypothetical protein